jgi:hypothetical protein
MTRLIPYMINGANARGEFLKKPRRSLISCAATTKVMGVARSATLASIEACWLVPCLAKPRGPKWTPCKWRSSFTSERITGRAARSTPEATQLVVAWLFFARLLCSNVFERYACTPGSVGDTLFAPAAVGPRCQGLAASLCVLLP